jgi:hypothetical protein
MIETVGNIYFSHPLLNTVWGDRHRRALRFLVNREYASAYAIGVAAGEGKRTDGAPLKRQGACQHGGRIAKDLCRLKFATTAIPFKDARAYYKATREGIAAIAKGELRYIIERLDAEN